MTLSPQNYVIKTQICISCTTGGKNIRVRNYNNFGSKIFSDGKISEFRNIDPRCDAIIRKLELSGQNLRLRCIFQLFEISEGFNH